MTSDNNKMSPSHLLLSGTSAPKRLHGITYAIMIISMANTPLVIQSFQPPVSSSSPLHQSASTCSPFSSSSLSSLQALAQRQSFLLDGGELESFLLYNHSPELVTTSSGTTTTGTTTTTTISTTASKVFSSPRNSPQSIGCLTFITGTLQEEDGSKRIVGIEAVDNGGSGSSDSSSSSSSAYETISLGNNIHIYKHTMAIIPDKISDGDALSTAAAAVVGVHCAIPGVGGVGGSEDGFVSGKAVVIGGNDYACFVADGLATLGIDVSLVSTGGANVKNKNVKTMSPSVEDENEEEVGFASAIGKFDSLIDTISNERKGMANLASNIGGGSSVIQQLRSKNQCNRYISTLTKSQQLIKDEGVIFGPGKANAHVKYLESLSPQKCTTLVPSLGFGPSTLQTLLENNVLFTMKNNNNKATVARGWTMKDFWEETSWPRDSSGTGVRYGFSTEEEEDLDELFRQEQRAMQMGRQRVGSSMKRVEEIAAQTKEDQQNPYVKQIIGVDGLAENVISQRKSCVVFVAMRSCRTCKGISPVFTKIAREHETDLMFAKADATGSVGKALGRQLGVEAVPSFVLFRDGIRYGAVSTSKLPSEKLDKAISDLEAGREFDVSLEEDDD